MLTILVDDVSQHRELHEDIHSIFMDLEGKKEIKERKVLLKKREEKILQDIKEVREAYEEGERFKNYSDEEIITLAFAFLRTWNEDLDRLDSEKAIPLVLRHNTTHLNSYIQSLSSGILNKFITLKWRSNYYLFNTRNEIQLRELFLS